MWKQTWTNTFHLFTDTGFVRFRARRCEAGADMRHRDAASGEWATGGAKLLAQATAAQLGMLITTTRWTGPTCCWKTVAMAGEWTAAGTATGRAVLMVPVGAVAMRRRAGGCSWRSRGSREPRDGLGGDSQHLLFSCAALPPPSDTSFFTPPPSDTSL